jgi:hypothetical protein
MAALLSGSSSRAAVAPRTAAQHGLDCTRFGWRVEDGKVALRSGAPAQGVCKSAS